MRHDFVGFGFGPIQAGLFAAQARNSGHFDHVTVAEIDPALVDAVRRNGDRYTVNVAGEHGMETCVVPDVRLLNPADPHDRRELEVQLAEATEMVTSLPSVTVFAKGGSESVAARISRAMQSESAPPAIVYTAENHNQAAEWLEREVRAQGGSTLRRPVQFLNTVIGKMSQVLTDPDEIKRRDLVPIAPGIPRAFLVEAFNHIRVTQSRIEGFRPGITVFEEKADLLPFEEAKLFGHNAVHTLLGFLGLERGCAVMSQLRDFPDLMDIGRSAFLDEIGVALRRRHGATGEALFTPEGWRQYAEDLLLRMTNPWLGDQVSRIVRDPVRKLGRHDRVFGPILLCLDQGVNPLGLAAGARSGIRSLRRDPAGAQLPDPGSGDKSRTALLRALWGDAFRPADAERVLPLLRDPAEGT